MSKKSVFGNSKNKIFKILEDNLKNIWDYDIELKPIDFLQEKGNYKLEDDEIFFIKLNNEESKKIKDLFNTTNADNIDKKSLLNIKYLFVIDKKNIYFQRIFKANLISKPFLAFSNDIAKLHKNETILVVQNRTEVVFKNDEIYFLKFSDLTAIFGFLDHYYREATNDDMNAFKVCQKIDINADLNLETLSKTTLRKVAQIVDSIDDLEKNFNTYKKYSIKYTDIFKNNKIKIYDKNDIETLHNVIFQKYYETDISSEKRLASSFKKIK